MNKWANFPASHRGTCQVCGRLHKMPNGVMSLHGYTKDLGFFMGSCQGSFRPPYELDRKFVGKSIESAGGTLEELNGKIANVYALDASKLQGWYRARIKKGQRTDRVWMFGTFEETEGYNSYTFTSRNGKLVNKGTFYRQSIAEYIEGWNESYAEKLERQAKQAKDYVASQQRLYEDWIYAPEKLVAIE